MFEDPHGLPPPRPHDHHLHLPPNTPPISVKPYLYPTLKRGSRITLFKTCLKGLHSKYQLSFLTNVTSLKQDRTWHFYVDYRALNVVIMRDNFPIPIIEEPFDELGFASIFTKLDLGFGYHQIQVHLPNTPKTTFMTFDSYYEFLAMLFSFTNGPSTF